MTTRLDDKALIDSFVEHMRQTRYPNLKVDRWPDEENRDSPDIDALAGSFAIEHTSVDTVNNQRRDSSWFLQAVGGLRKELSPNLSYRLNITFPYDGIQRGQNWNEIKESIKSWIINSSSFITDGVHVIRNVTGIPFQFNVRKASSRKAGLFFSRYSPDDNSLPRRIHDQLERKAKKLKPYQNQNYSTILLIESDDDALMNESIMIEAIRESFSSSLPIGVDNLWYADTAISDDILFHDFTEDIIANFKNI